MVVDVVSFEVCVTSTASFLLLSHVDPELEYGVSGQGRNTKNGLGSAGSLTQGMLMRRENVAIPVIAVPCRSVRKKCRTVR